METPHECTAQNISPHKGDAKQQKKTVEKAAKTSRIDKLWKPERM